MSQKPCVKQVTRFLGNVPHAIAEGLISVAVYRLRMMIRHLEHIKQTGKTLPKQYFVLLNGVLEGQATDLEIEARHILRMRDQIYKIYHEQTGATVEKIAADCERNLWLTADEMVDYGLCDEILEHLPAGKSKPSSDD